MMSDRMMPIKVKGKFNRTKGPAMLYDSESWATKVQHIHGLSCRCYDGYGIMQIR